MALMGPSIESPQELFVHKLGAALTMEETILGMLEDLQKQARDPKLKQALAQHHKETEQQVGNLQRVFDAIGEPAERQSCPAIDGLKKEGETMLRQVDDSLNDSVILSGVVETEHHEIAVYETLITNAEARGATDVAELLRQNLAQEQAALEKVRAFAKRIARDGVAVGA